jgi:hypothetical protein
MSMKTNTVTVRRHVTISLEISLDEDALRLDDIDVAALMESVAAHVRRAALGGLCPSLRPLAVATVGRDGIDYFGGAS